MMAMPMASPRVPSDRPASNPAGFPAYAYVPGLRPRPRHLQNRPADPPPASLDPDAWRDSLPYLRGIELFEHGYYWEAHEAWESLWIAAGREGPVAELLRGLILLAAAGVKIRQGRGTGAATLGARARRCFERVRQLHGTELAGLVIDELLAFADYVQAEGPRLPASPEADVAVVFRRRLRSEADG
jgi:predicted metal-dependent hydrolase